MGETLGLLFRRLEKQFVPCCHQGSFRPFAPMDLCANGSGNLELFLSLTQSRGRNALESGRARSPVGSPAVNMESCTFLAIKMAKLKNKIFSLSSK